MAFRLRKSFRREKTGAFSGVNTSMLMCNVIETLGRRSRNREALQTICAKENDRLRDMAMGIQQAGE